MKSCVGSYVFGCMTIIGVWLIHENRNKFNTVMKNIACKAEEMLKEMKEKEEKNCTCNECKN